MLWLLYESSAAILRDTGWPTIRVLGPSSSRNSIEPRDTMTPFFVFPQLVWPQLFLAVMTFTSFHVQIVNRLASGYPLWYLSVAKMIFDSRAEDSLIEQRAGKASEWVSRGIVMYSIVQGLLFSSFLPPA